MVDDPERRAEREDGGIVRGGRGGIVGDAARFVAAVAVGVVADRALVADRAGRGGADTDPSLLGGGIRGGLALVLVLVPLISVWSFAFCKVISLVCPPLEK